jgi:hypothetical protein
MLPHFRFAPFASLAFSRKAASVAAAAAMAIVLGSLGCMGLDGGSQNGTQSCEGTVNIPPNTTIEVVFPYPFAGPPTLTVYAWHGDWKIVETTDKSFKISNKNGSKQRTVEWKARGLRIMQMPPKGETRVISTPLTTTGPMNDRPPLPGDTPAINDKPPAPATIGPPR